MDFVVVVVSRHFGHTHCRMLVLAIVVVVVVGHIHHGPSPESSPCGDRQSPHHHDDSEPMVAVVVEIDWRHVSRLVFLISFVPIHWESIADPSVLVVIDVLPFDLVYMSLAIHRYSISIHFPTGAFLWVLV